MWCLDDAVHRGALADGCHNLRTILFGIDAQTSGRDAVFDQVQQRAAGLHNVRLHFDIAIVDDKNTLVRVEQNDALRHVIEDHRQQGAITAPANSSTMPKECSRHRGKTDGYDGICLEVLFGKISQAHPPPKVRLYKAASFY